MIRQLLCILAAALGLAPIARADVAILTPTNQADIAGLKVDGGAKVTLAKAADRSMVRVETGHAADWPGVELPASGGTWDLSACSHVGVDLVNAGDNDVTVFCRVDNLGADGKTFGITEGLTLKPGASGTLKVPLRRDPAGFVKVDLFGMRGYPWDLSGPWAAKGELALDPAKIVNLVVFVNKPTADHVFGIVAIRGQGKFAPAPPLLAQPDKFFPFIDEFGQYIHADWPGKTHTAEDLAKRRQDEVKELADHPAPADWDQYGGWKDGPKLKATGFFYATRHEGRWWLVDPDGRLFFSQGIDCVTPYEGSTPIDDRAKWFRELPPADSQFKDCYLRAWDAGSGHYQGKRPMCFNFGWANVMRKYGKDWSPPYTDVTLQRLRSWGLNTIGNWSSPDIYLKKKTPYTVTVGFGGKTLAGQGPSGRFRDVFDADFAAQVRKAMTDQVKPTTGDPWCIGYFVENEIAWGDTDVSLAVAALTSPAAQQAKRAFIDDLKVKYGDIAKLNETWGTKHASWEALLASTTSPDAKKAHADLAAFHVRTCETYFKTIRDALKETDHLYLGCRFSWSNPPAIAAAAKFCDVVSFNIYSRSVADFKLPPAVDAPLIVGEFHFGALDRGMFHAGLVPVADQAERAAAYKGFVQGALKHPQFVGCHWFKYMDEATTGRSYDGENYQIGFVDIADTPYPETVQAAREVAATMYQVRSSGK